jgi:hypothetical protein
MKSKTACRRTWKIIAQLFAGLLFWLVLTSCDLYDGLYPMQFAPTTTPRVTATLVRSTKALSITPLRRLSYPIYCVKASALEVRSSPGETSPNVGYLRYGDLVSVYQTARLKHEYCSTWARISPMAKSARWVCFENLTGE